MMKIQTINLIKSKLLFPILGMFVGILFSLCETMVAYSDTASPSEPIKEIFFNTISNNFFNKNTLVYTSMGIGIGLLLNLIISIFNRKRRD
ncbi:hypothetical protein [Capnocytophaga sputigena]|jgi:hypothetical protein|uniref:hypothetical protein n=1 Tax=Capnocytophaga sputigena TaxID=1019 RepID=UPI0028E65D78|nr:hypothetical protein [Capnocytophaga sputigena]